MKVKLKNFGVLKQAEFEVGDLTILCGGNNTGKTYATYALFGFLHMPRYFLGRILQDDEVKRLIANKILKVSKTEYFQNISKRLISFCEYYTKKLPTVFAVSEDKFLKSYFEVEIDEEHCLSDLLRGDIKKMVVQKREWY